MLHVGLACISILHILHTLTHAARRPGVHLAHRMSAHLLPEELKTLLPRGRMKPHTPPPVVGGYGGSSFFWGGLARIDVLQAPLSLRLTFNAFNLSVTHCPQTEEAEAFFLREVT